MNTLKAGAGTAPIHFTEEMFPTIGEYYTFSHDDSNVQVLCLEAGERYAILALGLVSFTYRETAANIVAERLGIEPSNVIIHIKHVLSTPHLGPHHGSEITLEDIKERSDRPEDNPMSDEEAQGYLERENMMIEAVYAAVRQAAESAARSIEPAAIGFATGYSETNVNRLVKTNKGWWNGTNLGGATDRTVPIIRLDRMDGTPIAILFNVNAAPGCLEGSFCADGGRGVSGDIAAYSERFILNQLGENTVAIFTLGASADQWQSQRAVQDYLDKDGNQILTDLNEDGFLLAKLLGERLGEQVLKAALAVKTHELCEHISYKTFVKSYPAQAVIEENRRLPSENCEYVPDGEFEAGCSVLTIGECAIVIVGHELSVETLGYIRKHSPYPHTFIMEFGNMFRGGYTAEERLYDLVCYQSRKTRFARGALEVYREDIVTLLRETYAE